MRQKKFLLGVLGAIMLGGLGGCNWLSARDNLNNGIRAYRETNYASAVEYFQTAVELDPELVQAELYLGMAYLQQFIPSAISEENDRYAELAIQTFENVLERNPEPQNEALAIAGLASIYQNTNRLDQAREYYLRQTSVSPEDPVAFYSVGSLNWLIVSDPLTERSPEEKAELIQEGQQHLDMALELDETYEDAMTYKNLLYRQSAELIPEDTEDEGEIAEREELIALADEWFNRAMETRQENAEREAAGLTVEN